MTTLNSRVFKMLCLLAALSFASTVWAVDLTVRIQNVSSADGTLQVGLFIGEENFPYLDDYQNPPKDVRSVAVSPAPVNGEQLVVFKNVAAGRYAVAVHHDVNKDGKFNRQMWPLTGMPSEPYGFSNHQWSLLGPATFTEALITVGEQDLETPIWLSTHLAKIGGKGKPRSMSPK